MNREAPDKMCFIVIVLTNLHSVAGCHDVYRDSTEMNFGRPPCGQEAVLQRYFFKDH